MSEIILNDNCKIFNGKFQDYIKSIDSGVNIVTDPPYNINFKYNSYEDKLTDEEYIEMISKFQGFPIAIIHYPEESMKYFVPSLGVPDEVLAWVYSSNLPNRQHRLINIYNMKVDFNAVKQPYKDPKDKRIQKLIEKGSKGTRMWDWFSDIQLVKNKSKDKFHPCPMPIKLMERIILLTTQEGDTIFDPFMGSGTTGIAALKNNRKFIGCEFDKKYFDIAKDRLEEILHNEVKNEK